MHKCLEIEEITSLIFSFLDKQDLLSVALTCKRLKAPALAILWREPDSIIPFLKLFPGLEWTDGGPNWSTLDSSIWTPKTLLAETPAVSHYAPLVRRIGVDYPRSWDSYLLPIALSFSGTHIFPNLEELELYSSTDPSILMTKALLSPRLSDLRMWSGTKGDVGTIEFLSQLGSICPSIETFSFALYFTAMCSEETVLAICDSLAQSVCSWNKLRHLEIPEPTADPTVIQHISRLPDFTSLRLRWTAARLQTPHSALFVGFDSLRRLALDYCSLSTLTTILKSMNTRQLEYLEGQVDEGPLDLWEEYFKTVSLRSVDSDTLHLRTLGYFDNQNGTIECSILRPLLGAGNLVELNLQGCYCIRFNDSFIEELTEASPKLTKLHIAVLGDIEAVPMLTLNAYRSVFRHCADIKELGLSVDTDTEMVSGDVVEEGREHKIRGDDFILQVGNSVVKDSNKLAAFLLPYFGHPIEHVRKPPNASVEIGQGWERVKEVLANSLRRQRQQPIVKATVRPQEHVQVLVAPPPPPPAPAPLSPQSEDSNTLAPSSSSKKRSKQRFWNKVSKLFRRSRKMRKVGELDVVQ